MTQPVVPSRHQPPLPIDQLCVPETPAEAEPMDVIFVGGGPAGLAGAIELARLVAEDNEKGDGVGDVDKALLEKAQSLGPHTRWGAVIKPPPVRAR
ncbi:MAG: hypothetical protein VYC96_07020 [Actinomycetota bacterium]|nr:hypothetical protein [Actinomycetota bacterium]